MRAFACLATMTLLAATAAGCTRFPALDDTITPGAEAAPYPALAPIGALRAQQQAEAAGKAATRQDEAALRSRAAALRARADTLRRATP